MKLLLLASFSLLVLVTLNIDYLEAESIGNHKCTGDDGTPWTCHNDDYVSFNGLFEKIHKYVMEKVF